MRTTIIPAQITTVEDKIAGSLNMTQILILMVPVLWTGLVYILFFPMMKLVPYKLVLITLVILISLILAFRIKDKIIAEWLGVLFRYHFRPRYWIFNKNDETNRVVDIPDIPNISVVARKLTKKSTHKKLQDVDIADLVKLEQLVDTGNVAIRYQFGKK